MAKIKYDIYPNPKPDAEGRPTYQVRHVPHGTMSMTAFLAHLKLHNTFNPTMMQSAVSVLRDEIVEQLKANHRFRIDGLGTFQMKVGVKPTTDEEGRDVRKTITDPKAVTARDVVVTGVSFVPDRTFIEELKEGTSTEKASATGQVGRSQAYTRQEVVNFLNQYLTEHHFITRRTFRILLGLSEYAARKWLDDLCNEESPKYVAYKEGNTIVYRRYGQH